jgi:dTDP-4-dehydrorhamnose 3,5-epimerase-like enzyme
MIRGGFRDEEDRTKLIASARDGDAPYSPADEVVVRWNDPALGIDWGVTAPSLSARDAANRPLAEIDNLPTYEG